MIRMKKDTSEFINQLKDRRKKQYKVTNGANYNPEQKLI